MADYFSHFVKWPFHSVSSRNDYNFPPKGWKSCSAISWK